MYMCTNVHTHRHSSDKWQSLQAVKRSDLIKLGGPGVGVCSEQEEGRKAPRLCLFAGSQSGEEVRDNLNFLLLLFDL